MKLKPADVTASRRMLMELVAETHSIPEREQMFGFIQMICRFGIASTHIFSHARVASLTIMESAQLGAATTRRRVTTATPIMDNSEKPIVR